jgi:hypothetical protein
MPVGKASSDPKADLQRYLQIARDAILWKLDGLSEYDVRHPLVATGTNLLGFSQYIETRYAADLLGAASGGGAAGVGYLLKDRVADVGEFVEALSRVAAGGTALDPEVVTQLLGASRRTDGLSALTARERDALGLMAEGRSNAAIAGILVNLRSSGKPSTGATRPVRYSVSGKGSSRRRRQATVNRCATCRN